MQDLLNAWGHPRCVWTGGYEGAERQVCRFLPDWQEPEDALADPEGPLAALEALFPRDSSLSHRDILGGLMGLGLTREKLGDILLSQQGAQVVVLREVLPILLSQWEKVGRYPVRLTPIPLAQLRPVPGERKQIRATVASPRLDAVIRGGRVMVNHRPCGKADKAVEAGDVLTCRGLGKCVLREIGGTSKRGRTILELERYL